MKTKTEPIRRKAVRSILKDTLGVDIPATKKELARVMVDFHQFYTHKTYDRVMGFLLNEWIAA